MKTLALVLIALVFIVGGCASDSSGNAYQPPSGPIGGGCGISAPVDDVGGDVAHAVSDVVGTNF